MRSIGWVIFAVTCVLSAMQAALLIGANQDLTSYEVFVENAFPLATVGTIAGAAVGAIIVTRFPRNRIGWLFCIGQLGSALSGVAGAYLFADRYGSVDAVAVPAVRVIAQAFNAYFTMAFLALIFLLAPDGKLPSRRWRFAPVVPVLACGIQLGVFFALPANAFDPGVQLEFSVAYVVFALLGAFALAVAILLGAIAIWRRLRVAKGELRQQLRWIAASAVVLTTTYLLVVFAQPFLGQDAWFVVALWYLAYIFVSVAVGVSILKYRLYDIDVILSKAIVLGVLAVFVTIGYIGVVVAIGAALSALGAPGSTLYWPSLVATALVATAFQPLRRYVLQLADQFVYGNRAAPYEALATMSRRLADSPTTDTLPARVAEATGRAVGARRTRVQLGRADMASAVLVANWPDDDPGIGESSLVLPVRDMGEQIGSIEVTMAPGRSLRTFERRLLQDVASQAGVAFRNALLAAELAARVDQTELRSAELAASRRRLVGVEDEARERLAASIRRGVVPHLTAVEAGIESSSGTPAAVGAELDRLITETERALDELRTVCRGVFPALLERRGLVPALSAQLDATHPWAVLQVAESADRRLDRAAEAAGYLFCIEVAPVDRPCVIELQVAGDQLIVTITGDGLDAGKTDWQHARDRVAALDGDVQALPTTDAAQQIRARATIPLTDQSTREAVMADHTASSRSGPNDDLGT